MIYNKHHGQSLAEYTLLITIVVMAAGMMFTAVKRGSQSLIKGGADQIGLQKCAEQNYNSKYGYMEYSRSGGSSDSESSTSYWSGGEGKTSTDTSTTTTETYSSAGFTED